MMYRRLYNPRGSVVGQVASLLVFGVLVAGAVVMGAVVLALVLAVGVVAGSVVAVRIWWLRRKLRQMVGQQADGGRPQEGGAREDVIDAEYTIVSERKPRERRKP